MTSNKEASIERDIAALDDLDRQTLLARWRSAFGKDAPPSLSQGLMRNAIAHEIQIKAFGGLLPRTVSALKAAAKPDAVAASRRLPSRGARFVREWNGVLHEVEVMDDGFLWHGQQYRSLSAIACAITGTKWSGPRFFAMTGKSR